MKKSNRTGLMVVLGLMITILVLPTLIVIPFTSPADTTEVEETAPKDKEEEEDSPFLVRVLRSQSEQVEEVPLETYVSRVVASEMPVNFELEALKAQALAARTYITRHMIEGGKISEEADVTDTVTIRCTKMKRSSEVSGKKRLTAIWKRSSRR